MGKKLDIRFYDISKIFSKLRRLKIDEEISKIKKSAKKSMKIYGGVREEIERLPYISESYITSLIIKLTLEENCEPAFLPIVKFNRRSTSQTPFPTFSTKTFKSALGYVDFGTCYKGYCTDVAFPIFFKRKYTLSDEVTYIISKIFPICRDLLKEGKIVSQVFSEMLTKLERILSETPIRRKIKNFKVYGHGIGLEPFEEPFFSLSNNESLMKNETLSIEISLLFDKFGMRIENNFQIKKNTKLLTKVEPIIV